MNIFLHEFKAGLKTAVIWTCSFTALIILFMSLYPSIEKDAAAFKKMLEGYPAPLQMVFGPAIENIASVAGFYSFIFLFVILSGAIQAMNMGLSVLSKELRERTADFLMTKPVSRGRIMTTKLLAALALLLGTNVICYSAASITASSVGAKGYDAKVFLMINSTLLFVQLMFFVIGLIVSVAVRKLKSVLPVSFGVVFGLFFIGMFLATDEKDIARYFSPFKYFDTGYIIKNGSYEVSYLLTALVFIFAASAASYFIYSRKDIHSVS